MYCMIHIQNHVYYRKFRHSGIFTCYSDIFSHIVACSKLCVTLAHSEACYIQNPGIFRIRDLFRTLPRHTLAHPEHCVRLAYWESCLTQNFTLFRNLTNLRPQAYSESCLFRHTLAFSGILNNDSHSNINFLFFTLIFHTFQRNLKRNVFWLQWHQFRCSTV